ncbi:MAG: PadR family transcriptional regulator [Acidobacteriaceae bacterium]
MPDMRDKRRRSDLDLFVLALIDSGISTPYEFQKSAGLSPGATIPTLQRLLEAGFVRQGKPGSRGRTSHSITPAGRKFLKGGWRILIEDGPSGDLDADLRVALLILWAGGKRQMASDFLQQSALKKLELLKSLEAAESGSVSSLADWYARLRSSSTQALLESDSAAAFAMAEALPPRLPAKATRTKRVAKR